MDEESGGRDGCERCHAEGDRDSTEGRIVDPKYCGDSDRQTDERGGTVTVRHTGAGKWTRDKEGEREGPERSQIARQSRRRARGRQAKKKTASEPRKMGQAKAESQQGEGDGSWMRATKKDRAERAGSRVEERTRARRRTEGKGTEQSHREERQERRPGSWK
jgi:hypothetical protein